jgi:uncharacterized membrane protein YdfJ with MMPL/SSD domain
MFRLSRIARVIFAALFVAVVVAVSAAAQSEKSTGAVSPTPETEKAEREKKLAVATDGAKQLLLVMDADKSGKVSKQEWMKFMEEEFDRLDTDHKGQLDVKELTQSRVRMRPYVGK